MKPKNPSHRASFYSPSASHRWKLSMVFLFLALLMIPPVQASRNEIGKFKSFFLAKRVIEVEIVENPRMFSFDETPVFDDGLPAYGGEFVTQGYIYPKGTLALGKGVDAEGNPEFPDLVIGTWFCRGWHIGDGAHTETGPVVITHQLFNFGETFGDKTITTDGVEIIDIGKVIKRAITGGTGPFNRVGGEQVQTLEGFNQFQTEAGPLVGVKLKVILNLYK